MATVGSFEAKTKFAELLARAERGEHITITRRGKPVAKITPIGAPTVEDGEAILARFKAARAKATLGAMNWKEMRDHGRKY